MAGLVVNRVLPDEADGEILLARRKQEGRYLEEIDRTYASLPRVRVPLLPGDVHEFDTLRRLGKAVDV